MKKLGFVLLLLTLCVSSALAAGFEDELALLDLSAFAIGTQTNIRSVTTLEADSLNFLLCRARQKDPDGLRAPAEIGLFLARPAAAGSRQNLAVELGPGDGAVRWARVTFEESGYQDDSVGGRRLLLWLSVDEEGALLVRRALFAQLCQRMYWRFYSAEPCP